MGLGDNDDKRIQLKAEKYIFRSVQKDKSEDYLQEIKGYDISAIKIIRK